MFPILKTLFILPFLAFGLAPAFAQTSVPVVPSPSLLYSNDASADKDLQADLLDAALSLRDVYGYKENEMAWIEDIGVQISPQRIADYFNCWIPDLKERLVLQLSDERGEVVLEKAITNSMTRIAAYGLANGSYLLHLIDERGEIIHEEWMEVAR